jgi:hypothetical protein
VLRPEGDVIQLLLEMTHFDNGLGLGHFKHLPKQDETAVNDVTDLLVVEGEIVLVGQEKLVGSGGSGGLCSGAQALCYPWASSGG